MKHENGKTCSMCTDCHEDVLLGRKALEMLASEEVPDELANRLLGALTAVPRTVSLGAVAWAWLREQLLGPAETVPFPPPANIPEAGRGPLLGSLATGGATGEDDGR